MYKTDPWPQSNLKAWSRLLCRYILTGFGYTCFQTLCYVHCMCNCCVFSSLFWAVELLLTVWPPSTRVRKRMGRDSWRFIVTSNSTVAHNHFKPLLLIVFIDKLLFHFWAFSFNYRVSFATCLSLFFCVNSTVWQCSTI